MFTKVANVAALVAVVAFASACASVATSDIVTLNLKAKGDGVQSGVITEEKDIDTESGNPYGAFAKLAKDELGKAPGHVELDRCTISLGAKSKGVVALNKVFSGKVEVLFLVDSGKNSYVAASIDKVSGSGPVVLSVSFDNSAISAADRAKIVDGKFKVVIRGNAAQEFDGNKDAEAELLVALTFSAFE